MRALCSKNVLQEELLFKYGLLTDIVKTLHEHSDNVGVLEESLSLLACLAADMEIVRRQCMIGLTHERVVEIIDAHIDSIPLIKTCLETLGEYFLLELVGYSSIYIDINIPNKFIIRRTAA